MAGKTKKPKRQYSDEQKAAVLANLEANNGNVAKTARDAEIPGTTLDAWKRGIGINDDVTNIRDVKKEDLKDLHKLIAVKSLGLLQNKLSDCSAQQLSTIAAISTDKMLVLSGEANSITQDVTKHSNEDRASRILELVKPATAKRA
jgi:hypothetical protein